MQLLSFPSLPFTHPHAAPARSHYYPPSPLPMSQYASSLHAPTPVRPQSRWTSVSEDAATWGWDEQLRRAAPSVLAVAVADERSALYTSFLADLPPTRTSYDWSGRPLHQHAQVFGQAHYLHVNATTPPATYGYATGFRDADSTVDSPARYSFPMSPDAPQDPASTPAPSFLPHSSPPAAAPDASVITQLPPPFDQTQAGVMHELPPLSVFDRTGHCLLDAVKQPQRRLRERKGRWLDAEGHSLSSSCHWCKRSERLDDRLLPCWWSDCALRFCTGCLRRHFSMPDELEEVAAYMYCPVCYANCNCKGCKE